MSLTPAIICDGQKLTLGSSLVHITRIPTHLKFSLVKICTVC